MSNYKSLSDLTELAIESEQKLAAVSGPSISLAEAVRQNLEVWEGQLFPLLRMQRKPIYDFLVPLLKEAGYESVTVSSITTVISRIRKEQRRGKSNG